MPARSTTYYDVVLTELFRLTIALSRWKPSWPRLRRSCGRSSNAICTATASALTGRLIAKPSKVFAVHIVPLLPLLPLACLPTTASHLHAGNPFGPFWDGFGIDFVGDREVPYGMTPAQWKSTLSPSDHLVVAMRGAPAAFPVRAEHRELAQYVEWNPTTRRQAEATIAQLLQRPFVSAHLRVG